MPEDGGLDEAADGDEELVAEVELPVAVEEAAEAEDVGLHGRDYDDLVGAVRGLVGEEEGCWPRAAMRTKMEAIRRGRTGFIGVPLGWIWGFGMINEEQATARAETKAKADPPPAAKDDN